MLTPRSIEHALADLFDGPRLRIGRTENGERAMMLERRSRLPDERRAPSVAAVPEEEPEAPTAPRTRPRLIDNSSEVALRRGLLRSAREGYDVFVGEDADAPRFEPFGPV